jgi:quinol monooxygenase YgiN
MNVSSEKMFSVWGRMTALPGRRDELITLVLDGFRTSGDGSGLLTYSINTVLHDPDTIWLTELWIDEKAHDATTHSAPVEAATGRVHPLLARLPEGCYGHAVVVDGRTAEPSSSLEGDSLDRDATREHPDLPAWSEGRSTRTREEHHDDRQPDR